MDYTSIFGAEPGAVAFPTTPGETAALIAEANAAGRAVLPWGGGTGQTYGYAPRGVDLVLDLSRMNRIIAHEPGDLTVTVEPGVTLSLLQKALAKHGQFLPLDPPHADLATIGGLLATDAFGPSRVGYGTARDWLIGISVIDAEGRVIKGGGKVVKNVTGYDLPKMHVGALGTLGVIVEATFKVAPLPEASRLLRFALVPENDGALFLSRLRDETSAAYELLRTYPPFSSEARFLTLVYGGPEEVAADEARRAADIAESLGIERASAALSAKTPEARYGEPDAKAELAVRVSGSPAGSWARHEAIAALRCWQEVMTLPGAGQTDAYMASGADPEAVARQMIQWGQTQQTFVALLHAPLALRQDESEIPIWSPFPPALPLMRRLKKALDPAGTLNPGRFIGGI